MSRYAAGVAFGLLAALTACTKPAVSETGTATRQDPSHGAKDQIVLSADEQAAAAIEVQPVTLTESRDLLRAAGRITRADDRVSRVGVRTPGLVSAVHANLGDSVRAGQILARYHADEVREGRAKYRQAVADLQRLQAAAALAQRNYDRAQTLLALKAASVMQIEQAAQDVTDAQTALTSGRSELERAKDLLEEDLHVPADATAGAAESDGVPILAPATGYILEKNLTPGRMVTPDADAFVIGDLSRVWMLASVRQDALGQLRVGQHAVVALPGPSGERFDGTIGNVGQELDPTTRTMQVRIVLENRHQRLRPEMLANAEIPVGSSSLRLSIPSDAVQQINEQDVVFIRSAPNTFSLRPVRVGPTVEGRAPVLEGITRGELVVVRGSFMLKSHLLRASIEGQ